LGRTGTPIAAILLSGVCILIAAGVSKLTLLAYNYLFGVALFDAMIVTHAPALRSAYEVQKYASTAEFTSIDRGSGIRSGLG
jgi:hypothetical protein